jgi:hypothetical protein
MNIDEMNDHWDNDPDKCNMCDKTSLPHLHYYMMTNEYGGLVGQRCGVIKDSYKEIAMTEGFVRWMTKGDRYEANKEICEWFKRKML